MDECIFCKIVQKTIPALIICEDADLVVMIDIKPTNPGHFLVLPKTHHQDFSQTPDELVEKLFVTAKRVAASALRAVSAQGFNTIVNTGLAAGQVIMHTHIHIIPRFDHDGLKPWPAKLMSPEALEQVCAAIKLNLK